MPQLFFRRKYVWFPVHLKGPMIPDPSGQLAELIVWITSTRVDLYSHQILLRLYANHYSPLSSNISATNMILNQITYVLHQWFLPPLRNGTLR